MSSFNNGQSGGGSSYIQQNQLFPLGRPLPVNGLQATVDPVQCDGNYKFNGRIEANQLTSGATELYFPNVVSQNHLNIQGGLTRFPTTTINSATGVTYSINDFKGGCIVRKGVPANTAVTDILPTAADFRNELITAGIGTRMECLFLLEFKNQTGAQVTFTVPADCTYDSQYSTRVFTSAGSAVAVLVQYTLTNYNLTLPPNANVRFVSQTIQPGAPVNYQEIVDVAPYLLCKETTTSKEMMLGVDASTPETYLVSDVAYPIRIYHGATNTFQLLTTGQFKCTGGFDITGNGQVSGTMTAAGVVNTGNSSVSGTATLSGNTYMRSAAFTKTTVVTESSAAARTYDTAEVVNTIINRTVLGSATGTVTDLMPSAASLVSTYGLAVGDTFTTFVKANNSASGFSYAFNVGTGGTAASFNSIAAAGKMLATYRTVITNATPGAEAYTVWRTSYAGGSTAF